MIECEHFDYCSKIRGIKEDGRVGLYNGYEHTCMACDERKFVDSPEIDAETMAKIQTDFEAQVERLRETT